MRTFILSGAGLSAPSGIPTFRSDTGLWDGHDINVVCNIKTFPAHRKEVFAFYNQRRAQLAQAQPTNGHIIIEKLQTKFGRDRIIHLTQNIDDLNERAGGTAIHLHGLLKEMRCLSCGAVWDVNYQEIADSAMCPFCTKLESTKPNVVFFGEKAPNYAILTTVLANLTKTDLLIFIGTSSQVLPQERLRDQMIYFPFLVNVNKIEDSKHRYNQQLVGDIEQTAAELYELVVNKMT